MSGKGWAVPVGALGLAALGRYLARRAHATDLHGDVALITGSSRGLGLALARQLALEGCRVVLSARHADQLERARKDVERLGAEVLAVTCDVSDRQQVRQLVQQTTERFGRIDVLIANAGVMTVGPLDTQTIEDFERAMNVMFWGVVYPTLEVLPGMRARRAGHIAVITSIGGKVSVPHLLPYGAAKFAAVGFSEGLRAELARDGIAVTTVVPGLMRTGSHLNAEFKGQNQKEFVWFSLGATLPMSSIGAQTAARQIVDAIKHGDAEVILSWQAKLLAAVQGLAPGLTASALGLMNRILPGPGGIGSARATGHESRGALSDSPIEALGRRAARDLNQLE